MTPMTLFDQVFSLGGAIAATVGFAVGFCSDQIVAHLSGRNRRT